MTVGGMARRLALVGGGLLAGVALLELLLRAGALVAPRLLDRSVAPTAGDEVRILCVGDSHTYGALVRPEEAYPERLERWLDAHGVPARVYNLGIPGQNSRQVRNHLPHELERYRPSLVLTLVGLNNYWNQTERADGRGSSWSDLRVLRFARLLRDAVEHPPEIEARRPDMQMIEDVPGKGQRWIRQDGDAEMLAMHREAADLDMPAVERVTAEDFTDMAAIVRQAGATPVFLTYPIELTMNARIVNRAMSTVATRDHVLRIDTRRILVRLNRQGRRTGFFFPDLHPKAPLYDEFARDVGKRLVRAGLVPTAP